MTRTKIQPLEDKNSWLSSEGMSATLHSAVAQPPHQLLAGKLINKIQSAGTKTSCS